MSLKPKLIPYALIILFVLVLPSQADEYCTTADACSAGAENADIRLGNDSYICITD